MVAGLATATVTTLEQGRAQGARHNLLAEAERQVRYAGYAVGPAGAPLQHLITSALAERPLPSEAQAAVLWSRIAPHVGEMPDVATGHQLRPDWSTTLGAAVGETQAEQLMADRLWPTIVGYVDAAAARGADPRHLVREAVTLLASQGGTAPTYQHPELFLTFVAQLTEPEPVDPETLAPDPVDLETAAPADADTAQPARSPERDRPGGQCCGRRCGAAATRTRPRRRY